VIRTGRGGCVMVIHLSLPWCRRDEGNVKKLWSMRTSRNGAGMVTCVNASIKGFEDGKGW